MVHHENAWHSFINEIGEPSAQENFVAFATLAIAMFLNTPASAKLGRVGLASAKRRQRCVFLEEAAFSHA
jgi:hypothetical protein